VITTYQALFEIQHLLDEHCLMQCMISNDSKLVLVLDNSWPLQIRKRDLVASNLQHNYCSFLLLDEFG